MKNFSNVFIAIKKHAPIVGFTGHKDRFKAIAKTADIPLRELESYLNTLHNVGIINYSPIDKSIRLTELGEKQKRLFTDY